MTDISRETVERALYESRCDCHVDLVRALRDALDKAEAKCAVTLGVGDGAGQLFVHGDYDSIKACQAKLLRLEKLEAELAAVRNKALEDAAKVANMFALAAFERVKAGLKPEFRASEDTYRRVQEGMCRGIDEVAEAIRALKAPGSSHDR